MVCRVTGRRITMGQGVLDDGEAAKEGGARGKPSLYHDQGT